MFYYLLFIGPQTREDFCLAFWPDSSIKRVRSNFHTTLYRARRALGDDGADDQPEKERLDDAPQNVSCGYAVPDRFDKNLYLLIVKKVRHDAAADQAEYIGRYR